MEDQNGFAEWGGYMDAKITKLEEQYSAASAPFRKSSLFAGISIFVNGLTNPSADELKRIMMVHGGTYHHYERSHTTFIIASNLPDVKVRNMDTSKIISAQWVVDCMAAKRILDYTPYLLYTNQKKSQPSLNFGKAKKESNIEFKPKTVRVAPQSSIKDEKNLNVKMGDNVDCVEKDNEKRDINSNLESKSKSNMGSVARTAVDPNFLPEFYNNSRLHHIATLGAGFKQYVSELREKNDSNDFPARLRLRQLLHGENTIPNDKYLPPNSTCVMHIDMDCFFVSVGLRKHPNLRGQPVAVTHSKGGSGASDVPVHPAANRQTEMELFAKRFEQHLHNNILSDKVRNGFDAKMSLSEIASCSYEARKKGVRNGMFVGQAIKLCPELKTIPYDFEGYKEVAYKLYDTIAQYTLQIEAVSCDELFVELTDVIKDLRIPVMEFVRFVRAEVREKTGCPCSAGVGANKLQARMATQRAKPDGQFHLEVNDVEAYMADILAEDLPGVGGSTNHILKSYGYKTCGDLQRLTLARLQGLVGKKHGETLYQFCRGIDNRPLAFEQIRKSVSAEVNYGIRFKEYSELEKFLQQLCAEVHSRLSQIKRKTKCITLKVMVRAKEAPVETSKFMGHGVCDNITKSVQLADFTNDIDIITRSVMSTMKNLNLPPHELRGIGIQLTKLDEPKVLNEQKENVLKNMFNKMKEKRKEVLEEKFESTKLKSAPSSVVELEPPPVSEDIIIEVHKDVPDCIEIVKSAQRKVQAPKKRPNVLGMLQDAHLKKQKLMITSRPPKYVLPNYIDAEVFEALPLNIREEILQELDGNKEAAAKQPSFFLHSPSPSTAKSMSSSALSGPLLSAPLEIVNIGYNELDEQPSTSRAAFERNRENNKRKHESERERERIADIGEQKRICSRNIYTYNSDENEFLTPSKMNVFLQPNCNQLLLQWITSDTVPGEDDINLCCDHACEAIRANQLNILYSGLSYLRKMIELKHSIGKNDPWFKAYCDIMASVDCELNILYPGRKLLTRDTILFQTP